MATNVRHIRKHHADADDVFAMERTTSRRLDEIFARLDVIEAKLDALLDAQRDEHPGLVRERRLLHKEHH